MKRKNKKETRGRKPKPRDKKYSRFVGVKMTEAEFGRITAEAKKRGVSRAQLLMENWRAGQ